MMERFMPRHLARDLPASIVVFLVAMPLCMGIAVASGLPAERGLLTGMVGGLVVGAFSGAPLQVSGPAAGLAVIVFETVREHGAGALGPMLMLAGAIQFVAGRLRLGQWFRAISPAVVHGMLAGIGVLIVAGQLHALMDRKPVANGLLNLRGLPEAFAGLGDNALGDVMALAIGLLTIAGLVGWERWRPASLRLVPGALVGVTIGALAAALTAWPVKHVIVPASIMQSVSLPQTAQLARLLDPKVMMDALVIAFIASAETLLSAAAVDRMHDGPRTRYDQELSAQGIGNFICGLIGGLPMTGVIVRSSANVQAGAASRASTMLHGLWILAFVALLPGVLQLVPTASLAGVLVVTGWRLVSLDHARHLLHRYGVLPVAIWAATLITVVCVDLLTGVLVGMGLTLLELAPLWRAFGLRIQHEQTGSDAAELSLTGAATFVQLPRLLRVLDAMPHTPHLRLRLRRLSAIDHTCLDALTNWTQARIAAGTRLELDSPAAGPGRLISALSSRAQAAAV